jgi:site-specific recombinase XerD
VKVKDAVSIFLVALRADGVKPETVIWYEHRLARFVARYCEKDIRRISLDDVRAYVVDIGQMGFAPYTFFTLVRVIRRLFKWLHEERRIDDDFYKRIKLPRLPQPVPKGIEMAEVNALLGECDGTPAGVRDRAVMLFLLDTGCRVGGLCGLQVGDVDLENKRAKLFEKGEKARVVLFGSRTAKALREWLDVRPFQDSPWLFTSMRDARAVTGNTVIQMLRRHAKRAGVTGRVNPHAFRHAFAREYILNGGDLASVSEMMGHTQIAVTKQFYAVFQAEELRGKHDAFSPVSHLPPLRRSRGRKGQAQGRAKLEGGSRGRPGSRGRHSRDI